MLTGFWCFFFSIYIKLPRRSSNTNHSQEAPLTWPNYAFYSLTHPPFHVAFVFCWLCPLLWLIAGYTVILSHTLILCSFNFNNQPITITIFYLSKILICIWPSHAEYHTCSSAWASSRWYFQRPKKPPLCMIAPPLHSSLLWIHCFILTTKFIFQNQSLLSSPTLR